MSGMQYDNPFRSCDFSLIITGQRIGVQGLDLIFVSSRAYSGPQQARFFARIIALAEISTTPAIDRLCEWP